MKTEGEWIAERFQNTEIRYRINAVLHKNRTPFQDVLIVDTIAFGKMLLLDGIVQTTEKDEFVYHEMMAHVPMRTHEDPQKILIIGGGDGGILREVLRYPVVTSATVVEIDEHVIGLSKKYLPGLSNGAFDQDRTKLLIADGDEYLKDADDRFDIVIVDSSDPVGPSDILFSEQFYRRIHQVLAPGGIFVAQTGSLHEQAKEQHRAHDILSGIFRYTAFYTYAVPTYVGGLFSSIFCSDAVNPKQTTLASLNERCQNSPLKTHYYSPGIHVGAFHIPPFLKRHLRK